MEIKPCAHCGGRAVSIVAEGKVNKFFVCCTTCGVRTLDYFTIWQPIDIWSSRVEQPSEADRWLADATEQRSRAELAEMQRDELAEALEAIKRGMIYGGVIQ